MILLSVQPGHRRHVERYYRSPIPIVAIGTIVVFTMSRFDLSVGGEPGQLTWLLLIPVTALLRGVGLALYFRSAKTEYYDNLGRA